MSAFPSRSVPYVLHRSASLASRPIEDLQKPTKKPAQASAQEPEKKSTAESMPSAQASSPQAEEKPVEGQQQAETKPQEKPVYVPNIYEPPTPAPSRVLNVPARVSRNTVSPHIRYLTRRS